MRVDLHLVGSRNQFTWSPPKPSSRPSLRIHFDLGRRDGFAAVLGDEHDGKTKRNHRMGRGIEILSTHDLECIMEL